MNVFQPMWPSSLLSMLRMVEVNKSLEKRKFLEGWLFLQNPTSLSKQIKLDTRALCLLMYEGGKDDKERCICLLQYSQLYSTEHNLVNVAQTPTITKIIGYFKDSALFIEKNKALASV